MQFQLWDYGTSNFLAVTAAAVGTIDVKNMSDFSFNISGLTGETVNVTISYNGVDFSSDKIRPINMNTGAVAGSSDLGNGTYLLNVKSLGFIKFTKSAAVESVSIRCGLGR